MLRTSLSHTSNRLFQLLNVLKFVISLALLTIFLLEFIFFIIIFLRHAFHLRIGVIVTVALILHLIVSHLFGPCFFLFIYHSRHRSFVRSGLGLAGGLMAAYVRHLISISCLLVMVERLARCSSGSWGLLWAWIIGTLLGVAIDEDVVANVDFFR